jgi:methionyl-tRNA formyltransferase
MDILLLFADARLFGTAIFVEEICRIMQNRKDVFFAGVVDTGRLNPPAKITRILKFLTINPTVKIFNPEMKIPIRTTSPVNLYDICRRFNVEVFVPPGRNVNSLQFVNYLKETLHPTLGLSVGCLQVFRKPLIDILEVFVNYHNGLLPYYRGLNATKWSRFLNEKYTGFTYHLINERIDDGNILIQDSIPITEDIAFFELEYKKTMHARNYLERVIELMLQRSNGIEQKGSSRYFGRKDLEIITTIDHPSQLTLVEIQKRLRIFGHINFHMDRKYYPVTKIKAISGKRRGRSINYFVTRDNVVIKPKRILYLPAYLYKIYEFIKRFHVRPG